MSGGWWVGICGWVEENKKSKGLPWTCPKRRIGACWLDCKRSRIYRGGKYQGCVSGGSSRMKPQHHICAVHTYTRDSMAANGGCCCPITAAPSPRQHNRQRSSQSQTVHRPCHPHRSRPFPAC